MIVVNHHGRNLTKLLVSPKWLRLMSSSGGEQKPKDGAPKINEAQSYEKWLANVNSYKKDAKFRLGYYKEALVNWRKGQSSTEEWYAERVSFWMKRYENFVGLTEVKAAQALVVKEEQLFIAAQERRRETQIAINDVQAKLKGLRSELERTPRGEDKYLELITQEHSIIKEENALILELQGLERTEREKFSRLSTAVRDSHEKERAQAEKTKYWSVIGSVVGTCLGVFGTTINNRMRMKELRQIVKDSTKVHSAGGAAAAAVGGAAASAITVSALSDHQNQLENMSESFLGLFKNLDEKLNQLDKSIQKSTKPVVTSTVSNGPISEKDLKESFDRVDQIIKTSFKNLENGLMQHDTSLAGNLASVVKARDEKFIEALKQANSSSYNSFSSRVCDIEEKVRDIRSLLLAQSMSLSDSAISSSVKQHSSDKAAAKSMVGAIDLVLKDHEERITNQLLASGIVVAILVPIVTLAISKLF